MPPYRSFWTAGVCFRDDFVDEGTLIRGATAPPGPVGAGSNPSPAFDPAGRSFLDRLEAFIAAALREHGVKIATTATLRDPADAQKWHIAHMFYYNSYKSLRPKISEKVENHWLIAWTHISRADLVWHKVDWKDFLRTVDGQVPVKAKDGRSWEPGMEPDKVASKKQAYGILQKAGIATSSKDRPHDAMVAPGFTGCGEPCRCGGNPSRHTAGMAADLKRSALDALEKKLAAQKAGTLDAYLKKFGLMRPMLTGKNAEPWHVEAIGS